jgi:hypothetical protein
MNPPALHFIGDSHTEYLRNAVDHGYFAGSETTMCMVGGATAVGMRNPKSVTNALEKMLQSVVDLDRRTVIIMQLGEVDCGFVIWYRARKYGETIEHQLDAALAAYSSFVVKLLVLGFARIILTGATLPTIKDDHPWGEIADLRREISVSIQERTQLTLRYNQSLRIIAHQLGVGFVDISAALIDPATGIIKDAYRHPNPRNHHLHPVLGARLWGEHLTKALEAR